MVWSRLSTNFFALKFVDYRKIKISVNLIYLSTSIFLILSSIFITNIINKKLTLLISSKTVEGLIKLGDIVEDKNNWF